MRDTRPKSPVDPVWRDPAYNAPVCAESAALPGVGSDLQTILLNYTLDALLVDSYALLSQLAPQPPIAMILMLFPYLLDLLKKLRIRIFTAKALLPIHVRRLWKANCCENVL